VADALADADQLLQTFQALLRIARLESGSYQSDRRSVALTPLVGDAVELYQAIAEDKAVKLTASVASGAAISGDRDLLFQLLVNLIDNAVKYTPDGGSVRVTAEQGPDWVELSVADSGPGIAPELRGRVLDRFFRVDSSRQLPGNGLGLSLVHAIARYHHAELALEGNDPGLRVIVRFPVLTS
jgi:signal transduction histidine kinase